MESFLSKSPIWFGEPSDWFLLDYARDESSSGKWPEGGILSHPLSRTEILFIYAKTQDAAPRTSVLSIHEMDNKTIYTLSIEQESLIYSSLRVVEEWLVTLFRFVHIFGASVLFAGSETEWQEDCDTTERVIENAFSSSTYSYWIALERLPAASYDGFEIAQAFPEGYLLRRRNVLEAIGFSID